MRLLLGWAASRVRAKNPARLDGGENGVENSPTAYLVSLE
jgi:hypothetical protein